MRLVAVSCYRRARRLEIEGWSTVVLIVLLVSAGIWGFFAVPNLVLGDFRVATQAQIADLRRGLTDARSRKESLAGELEAINARWRNPQPALEEAASAVSGGLPADVSGGIRADLVARTDEFQALARATTVDALRPLALTSLQQLIRGANEPERARRLVEAFNRLSALYFRDRDQKIEKIEAIQAADVYIQRTEASLTEAIANSGTDRLILFQTFTNLNRFGFLFIVLFVVYLSLWMYRYKIRVAGHYRACGDALSLLASGISEPAIANLPDSLPKILAGLSPAAYDIGKPPKTVVEQMLTAATTTRPGTATER